MAEKNQNFLKNLFVTGAKNGFYISGGIILVLIFIIIWWLLWGRNPSINTIANQNDTAVVYIEVGWKLIYTQTGEQIYHKYVPNQTKRGRQISMDGRAYLPAFIQTGNSIEPYLTTNKESALPIGGEHTGTGFAVTDNGFILTNRHVAAPWKSRYEFSLDYGVLLDSDKNDFIYNDDGEPIMVSAPEWVPSESKQAGRRLQGGFEGRNDYLNVMLPHNSSRIPAKLARISESHDVAMIKIDVPEKINKVKLHDNYDAIKKGDEILVLGYPGVSPVVFGYARSFDVFNPDTKVKVVQDPTVSVGYIGRILRSREKEQTYSSMGDVYQLTINSTGSGNSGGPVFDAQGRAIGIFFASRRTDVVVTFAIPIRYGIELLSTKALE
jgi:S1-C subfamily serine protease